MNKIINIVLTSLIGGSLVLWSQETLFALEQNRIPASVAQGKASKSATMSVSPYGVVLSFEEVGESIEKYWATDGTYLRVGTNAPLGKDANILFLKTEGKWPESKNGTSLTVKTKDTSGKTRTYSFFIDFTEAKPKYAMIRIYPDEATKPIVASPITKIASPQFSRRIVGDRLPIPNHSTNPVPLIPSMQKSKLLNQDLSANRKSSIGNLTNPVSRPTDSKTDVSTSASQPSDVIRQNKFTSKAAPPPIQQSKNSLEKPPASKKTPTPSSATNRLNSPKQDFSAMIFSHTQANALVRGLTVATKTGEVGTKSVIASKIQSIIRRLRRGEKLTEASKNESVEQKTISRLLQLGNYKDLGP